MINCKYEYKGHLFENEIQLNDFLISKAKYESEFGDLVFQVRTEKLGSIKRARELDKETRDMKKAFEVSSSKFLDGEDVSERTKTYIGVTAYLASYIREDGSPLSRPLQRGSAM